jgi:hypothetical protein
MLRKLGFVAMAAAVGGFVVLGGLRAAEAKPIDEGKAEAYKGKAYDVKAKEEVVILLAFPAGKKFHVSIKSDQQTDINLFIYDETKKEVAKDDSPGPDCDRDFAPTAAGKYTLIIRNVGATATKSTLKVEVKE